MFSATLQKLRKPLTAESKLGFGNSAVIGGLGAYMCSELERALGGVAECSTPPEAEFRLQRLLTLWHRYADSDIMERRNIVQESVRLLEELQAEGASDNVEATSSGTVALDEYSQPAVGNGSHITINRTPEVQNTSPTTQAAKPDNCSLDTELTYLKGVGPKRAEALNKLRMHTVYDLLYFFPARYEDRRVVKPISQVEIGAKESICATVLFPPQTRRMGGRMGNRPLTKVRVGDASGRVDLQWWNQPFREKQFQPGNAAFHLRQNYRVQRHPANRHARLRNHGRKRHAAGWSHRARVSNDRRTVPKRSASRYRKRTGKMWRQRGRSATRNSAPTVRIETAAVVPAPDPFS
jgi:ATP-dependent DNA helicase RecG